MKKVLVMMILLMTLLTSCIGLDAREFGKVLNKSNCFYNEELGIEFNRLDDPTFSSGYITEDNIKIDVMVAWNYPLMSVYIYKMAAIDFSLNDIDALHNYVNSEESKSNIIMSGSIEYDGSVVIKIVDSYVIEDISEIVLNIK